MFTADHNNRNSVTLTSADGATVVVHQQGAHITSWKTADGKEILYMSPAAVYKDGTALRGGVPVIWPQFSDMGNGPTHGVARNRNWALVDAQPGAGTFSLKITADDSVLKNVSADVQLIVHFSSKELRTTLKVKNTGAAPLSFTTAMHTYFAVSAIEKITIHGLDNVAYADNLQKRQVCEAAEIRVIDREIDRMYFDTTNPVVVADPQAGRNLVISGSGMNDVVLWNPWIEKTKKLADMPAEGYKDFVCVEHGVIRNPVVVAAGESWEGSQIVTVTAQSKM